MIALAIGILWFAIGVAVVAGCIFVAFWLIGQFVAIPALVQRLVWGIFLILCLIAVLSMLESGGLPHPALFR
jgi:hypothetical protein